MEGVYEKLLRCRDAAARMSGGFEPRLALILGSGLESLAETMDIRAEVPYRDIPGFPVSTVSGHKGCYLFGMIGGVPVVCMQGRVHYYEGFDIQDVVLPTRVMGLLGARTLFLTNAAGCLDPAQRTPALMILSDHIMLGFPNPLIGPNLDNLGPRFPDMSEIYDSSLRAVLRRKAQELGIDIAEGVYVQLTGPSFETPAEVRLLRSFGATAVGMSTACEAVAARHMGLRVCGVSCLANPGAGISRTPLTHEEVQQAGRAIGDRFTALVKAAIPELDKA
jgi:inosine guanosine and xanthosine phosphorylase family